MDIQGANLFFQLIARRYEKASTIFTSNKNFSQWNEIFADVPEALTNTCDTGATLALTSKAGRLRLNKGFIRAEPLLEKIIPRGFGIAGIISHFCLIGVDTGRDLPLDGFIMDNGTTGVHQHTAHTRREVRDRHRAADVQPPTG